MNNPTFHRTGTFIGHRVTLRYVKLIVIPALVINCYNSDVRKFTIPNPLKERARAVQWISACGNTNVNKRRNYVCLKHFESKYVLNRQLSKSAVPTLNLPDPLPHAECLRLVETFDGEKLEQILQKRKNRWLKESTKHNIQLTSLSNVSTKAFEEPNNSIDGNDKSPTKQNNQTGDSLVVEIADENKAPPSSLVKEKHRLSNVSTKAFEEPNNSIDGIDKSPTKPNNQTGDSLVMEIASENSDPSEPLLSTQVVEMMQKSYLTISRRSKTAPNTRKKKSTLSTCHVARIKYLGPKEVILYRKIHNLRTTNNRLKKQRDHARSQLKKLQQVLNTPELVNSLALTSNASTFFTSQIRNQHRHPNKRTFNLEDKTYALAIHKKSPSVYKFLRQDFSLPSEPTLTKLTSHRQKR